MANSRRRSYLKVVALVKQFKTSKSDVKSEAKVVQSASQDETDVASASSEAQPKNETKSDTKDPATPAAGIDVNALAAGDFSSVAGTWQNDLGMR